MDLRPTLISGMFIGLAVAVPVGPTALACIRRTLTGGWKSGVTTGAGASTINLVQAALLVCGLQQVGQWLAGNRLAFSVLGLTVQLFLAYRSAHRRRVVLLGRPATPCSLVWTYLTTLCLNGLNPLGVLLLAGAASTIIGPNPPQQMPIGLVVGVFVGSFTWWIGLSSFVSLLRKRLSDRLLCSVNRLAGAGTIGFGALSVARSLAS